MMDKITSIVQSKWTRRAAAVVALAWVATMSVCAARPRDPAPTEARGLTSGGGMVLGNGGLTRVVISAGILTGSGTTANPLGATVSQGSGLSGTGSSGSPLIVGAGSGISAQADSVSVNAGSGLTSDASNVRANLGTGLAFSAGAIVPNLAGGTCTNDQGVTSLSSAGTATCGNVGRNAYGGTHLEWADEFIINGANTATSSTSWGIWGLTQAGTGQVAGNTVGTTTRPGILEHQVTSSATPSRTALLFSTVGIDFGSGSWTWEWVGGWPTLSDTGAPTDAYTTVIGFTDTANTTSYDVTDGCYFLYDTQNVAAGGANSGKVQKLECACASNAVRTMYLMDGSTVSDESFTTVDATVAALTLPSTNIYHLKVVMTGTTRAEFFVDSGGGLTKRCDINTHIPSGSTRLTGAGVALQKTTGTTNSRTVNSDWARVAVDLTSARSP
jgi:hypothetical protein